MKRTNKELRDDQKLYIFRNSIGKMKIGISIDVEKRRRKIENASGLEIEIIKVYNTVAPALPVEQTMHKALELHRQKTNKNFVPINLGEWFAPISLEVIEYELIKAELEVIDAERRAAGCKEIEYAYNGLEVVSVDVLPLDFENSLYSAWNIEELEHRAILLGILEKHPELSRFFQKHLMEGKT